jgi:hypothetical protein
MTVAVEKISLSYAARPSGVARLLTGLFLLDFLVAYIVNPFVMPGSTFAGLALPQVVRGITLVILSVLILKNKKEIRQDCKYSWRVYKYGIFVLALISLFEVVRIGGFPLASANAYLQIVYWLSYWVLFDLVSKSKADARYMAVRWIFIMAIMAASIYYGVKTGAFLNSYEDEGVSASAGIAGNVKGVSGQLLVACFLTLFLTREKHKFSGCLLALFFLGGSFLTYARAGMVGAALAILWIVLWNQFFRDHRISFGWAGRFLFLCILTGTMYFAVSGTGGLQSRWEDVSDPTKGGSGRALLWAVAVDEFMQEGRVLQMTGMGYQSLLSMMERRTTLAAHTHNDLLDAITIGGILGISLFLAVALSMVTFWRTQRLNSASAAMGGAILMVLLGHSLLTGQIFAPDVMMGYVLALTCIIRSSPEDVRLPQSLSTAAESA